MPGRRGRRKLYQFVDALVETGTREIVSQLPFDDEERAREVMRQIAHSICHQYGRSVLYVPADLEFTLNQRDADIWAKYGQDGPDGVRKYSPQRVAQLAEEYRLTTVQVYAICRLAQRREIESRQGRLPGLEEVQEVAG